MNHDDEKNPDLQAWIEPELEARLVAAILGEASAFEAAELERLTSEKPELAIFKRRIEAVHGLVGLAERPDQAPLRLAPERRAKILQAIGATPARPVGAEANAPILLELATARRKRRKKWIWASGLAASVTFASILTMQSSQKMRQSAADKAVMNNARQLAAASGQNFMETRRAESERPSDSTRLPLPAPGSASFSVVPSEVYPKSFGPAYKQEIRESQISGATEMGNRRSAAGGRSNNTTTYPAYDAAAIDLKRVEEKRERGLLAGLDAGNKDPMSRPSPEQTGWTARTAEVDSAKPSLDESVKLGEFKVAGLGLREGNSQAIMEQKLSPFVVDASKDQGYGGTNPLAGTRPNTDLKDLASSMKVVTAADAFGDVSQTNTGDFLKSLPGGNGAATPPPASDDVKLEAFSVSPKSGGKTRAVASNEQRISVRLRDVASNGSATAKNDGFLSDVDADAARDTSLQKEAAGALTPSDVDERLSQEKAKVAAAVAAAAPPAKLATPPDSPRNEISAAKEAVSTFSLHVSDVSFRLAQAVLARGETPDPERIRPEEFYNAFDYGDPAPTAADKIGCRIEQAAHPLIQQRNLVRIAMKVPSTGRGAGQPLHLTVLLDTSGSMEREDRIASVHRALEVLAGLLGTNDRVTLIGFARQPRLLVEQLPGDQAAKLVELASHTPFTGGTNLEEALKLSGELARRHRDPSAQNRIVLITDGAANLGNADPAQLAAMIETLRQQGVAFDACGVGTDGLDDAVLESLTRKGDGRYYVIDKPEDADAGFARQLAGAFRPAAENVKVQVRFNPARVGNYRLIGFEQHRLREEDFRNDKVDAAELAADEAAIALYQVEVLPQGEGELGEVFVRFRDAASGNMVERSWTMLHEPKARAFDRATPTLQLAGTAALLAEKLRGGDLGKLVDLGELTPVVNGLRGHYAHDARVQDLIRMFEQMRRRGGK